MIRDLFEGAELLITADSATVAYRETCLAYNVLDEGRQDTEAINNLMTDSLTVHQQRCNVVKVVDLRP